LVFCCFIADKGSEYLRCSPNCIRKISLLWGNSLVSERCKKSSYNNIWHNSWFWRTKDQNEIDYLEEGDGQLYAYEFKWNPNTKVRKPKLFADNYPDSEFSVITPDNMDSFLL
jgi:hypothetical protein